jgi:phospholipid transport system substrate-binding protein
MIYQRLAAGITAALPTDHRRGWNGGAWMPSLLRRIARLTPVGNVAKAVAATLLVAGILTAPNTAAGEDPADFIRILGNQGLEVIRSNTTLGQKADYFHQMLHEDFDLTRISQFVLGPYWRMASAEQRQEFRSLLSDHLVRFYGEQFAQYGGESLSVTGSRSDPAGVLVTSQIIRRQGPPLEVDWQLRVSRGRYRISDVIVDGVSMAATQRSQFAAIIQRSGGQVGGLLVMMREQI